MDYQELSAAHRIESARRQQAEEERRELEEFVLKTRTSTTKTDTVNRAGVELVYKTKVDARVPDPVAAPAPEPTVARTDPRDEFWPVSLKNWWATMKSCVTCSRV